MIRMSRVAAAASAILALASADRPAAAQSISVVQSRAANVYGLVQAGDRNPSVSVRQTGGANVVGVIQASRRNDVSIVQNGTSNQAAVGQFSWGGFANARSFMP